MTEQSTSWPTSTDYTSAVQLRETSFVSAELAPLTPIVNAMGVPTAATGQNAAVFLLNDSTGDQHALRCFTSAATDGNQRYAALSRHLRTVSAATSLAPASWIDDAIVVNGRTWPVVKMPWIPGRRLDVFVEDAVVTNPASLVQLADTLRDEVLRLQEAGIAHGDLQHGNILISDDLSLTLVDLDGVWVSSSNYPPPHELGHPNYQHPGRSERCWGPLVDSFSTLLICVSLRALAADRRLSERMGGENLVFRQADFATGDTDIWNQLSTSTDDFVRWGADRLRSLVLGPPEATLLPLGQIFGETPQPSPSDPNQWTTVNADVGTPGPIPTPPSTEHEWWVLPGDEEAAVEQPKAAETGRRSRPVVAADTGPRPPVSRPTQVLLSGPAGSAIGGGVAGLLGCVLFAAVEGSLPLGAKAPVFVILVAGLIGLVVLGWNGLASGRVQRGLSDAVRGLAIASVAALASVLIADLIVTGSIRSAREDAAAAVQDAEATDIDSVDVPVLPVALAWAITAGFVGAALGFRQSTRAALLGLGAGLGAGLGGGLLHAATAASTQDEALVIEPLRPATLLATAIVATLIAAAIAAARRSGAHGILTVMEGRMAGAEVLLKQSNSIGSRPSSTLVLEGRGLLPEHAGVHIERGRGLLTAFGPLQLNGQPVDANPDVAYPLESGDVVRVGSSYIRFTQRSSD